MPDYIYLLENRLSIDQRNALRQIGQAAREADMTVFLVGGAVRDLTSGSSVRDLDVAVQGNALKLKKTLEKKGAKLWGENEASRTLFFRFPVGVRVELSSTRREEYPKPGKPVYHWDSILEDLRHRDFTANAMALSLNERSYGLLMDPLNGVADIEARHLRLVGNYGFLEEPSRLLRATRLAARLGWELDERTKARFENAREEGVMDSLSSYQRGYELEEIGHEEDGLRILAAMENQGWMRHLDPAWTVSKADAPGLEEMHRLFTKLQMQGVSPDHSAASMQLLTAKMQAKDVAALKKMFVRPGFVEEWNHLDTGAKDLARQLTAKEAATPSATWKIFTSADPQAVLWLGLTSKSVPIQAKYNNFLSVWPEARQKVPHALMLELRITPEIARYEEMLTQLFFGVIDGKLDTEEQLRAFLEPFSPPAPPPPVTVRRTRGPRKTGDAKTKVAVKAAARSEDEEIELDERETEVEDEDEEAESPRPPAAAKSPAKKTKGGAAPSAKAEQAGKGEPAARRAPAAPVKPQPAAPVTAKSAAQAAAKPTAKPGQKPAPNAPPSGKPAKAPAAKPAAVAHLTKKHPAAQTQTQTKTQTAKAAVKPALKAAPKPASKKDHAGKNHAGKSPAVKPPAKKPAPAKKPVPAKKPTPAKKAKPAKKR